MDTALRARMADVAVDGGWLDAPDDAVRRRLLDALADDRAFVESVLTAAQLEALDFGYRERVVDVHLPWIRDLPRTLPVLQGELNFVYAYLGAMDRMLDFPERNLKIGIGSIINANHQLWPPERAAVRKTQRFKAYVREAGLVDYWRERGWPDLCRPVGADDFVCE